MAYTPEQEARMKEFDEIDYAQAGELAQEFGYSRRSVIAKALSLEIPYVRKPAEPKRPRGMTKAELVRQIAENLEGEVNLEGLEKATSRSLDRLAKAVAG